MKKKHHAWLWWIVLALWLVVAGVGYMDTQTDAKTSSSTKTVRIGYQKGDIFDIARIQGGFAKRMKQKGYRVVWKEFQTGAALLTALNSGKLDYGRTGNTPPITSQASGSKLVYVGAASSRANSSGLLVSKTSSAKTIKDLKGKKIAYSKGSSSQYLLLKLLAKAGMSANDIKWVDLDLGAASTAFSQGKVDAWVVWDPYVASAQVTQNAKLIESASSVNTTDRDFILATSTYAKKHTKTSSTLLSELETSMEWANRHHTTLIKDLSSALSLDKKVVTKMVDRRRYSVSGMTQAIVKEQQDIADTLAKAHDISGDIDVSKAVLTTSQ